MVLNQTAEEQDRTINEMDNTYKEFFSRVDSPVEKINKLGKKYDEGNGTEVQVRTNGTIIMGEWKDYGVEIPDNIEL